MRNREAIPIPPSSCRRLRALAILKYGHQHRLHARLPVSPRTLAVQLEKGQLTAPLAQALRAELGEAGWLFICGQTDTLRDEGTEHADA
jgi:hypothetical protein